MKLLDKIKEYLFNTATTGVNIDKEYLKQTVKFLNDCKEEPVIPPVLNSKYNLPDFARYIQKHYSDEVCDAWTRKSDGKLFYNAEEVYEEFIKSI